jgi:hypothetical protein
LAEPRRPSSRHGLSPDSPLLGHSPNPDGYDHQTGVLDLPPPPPEADRVDLRDLRGLVPAAEPGREIDDWGRSQRVFDVVQPLLDFYYRHWFRDDADDIALVGRLSERIRGGSKRNWTTSYWHANRSGSVNVPSLWG